MTYEVFSLKYRPKTFQDVIGQTSVASTLQRAVEQDRVANAFLFCGSRGTGKTSMARILARALNCAQKIGGEPCNTCEICRQIARGEDIDVIEIDGASNRGIDEIRGIKDNAGYVPARSRYKIFIIDEVHMLTIQAFNALLKVLEEPPAHVKFIFATTDPNNLPDTILSRCQRYEFRRIGTEDIVGRLAMICSLEGISADDEVLKRIATKSEGGMRDSVSLLDQVVSYAGNTVTVDDLERAIGMLPREHLEGLMTAVGTGDLAAVLGTFEAAHSAGFDPQELLLELIQILRRFMVWHAAPGNEKDARQIQFFAALKPVFSLDRVLYVLRLFLATRGETRRSGQERLMIELALMKAARSREFLPLEELAERLKQGTRGGELPPPQVVYSPHGTPAESRTTPPSSFAPLTSMSPPPSPLTAERVSPALDTPAPTPRVVRPAPAPTPALAPIGEGSRGALPPDFDRLLALWAKINDVVKTKSAVLASALREALPVRIDGRRLVLEIPGAKRFAHQQLGTPAAQATISECLRSVSGYDLGLSVLLNESLGTAENPGPRKSAYDDPAVKRIVDSFDGNITHVERRDG